MPHDDSAATPVRALTPPGPGERCQLCGREHRAGPIAVDLLAVTPRDDRRWTYDGQRWRELEEAT